MIRRPLLHCATLVLFVLWMHALPAQSQDRPIELFTLTSCPQASGVDKAAFNAQYGRVGSEAQYLRILKSTFNQQLCCTLRYTVKPANARAEYHVYHIPSAKSRPARLSSLSSKGNLSSMVEGKRELRDFFSDTLALWDTLHLRVRLADADLGADGYYLVWTDPRDGGSYKSTIPAASDTLLISWSLFGDLPNMTIAARLRHRDARQQDLARMVIRPVLPHEQDALVDLVCALASEDESLTSDKQHQLLHQFCTEWYGRIPMDQLPAPASKGSARP